MNKIETIEINKLILKLEAFLAGNNSYEFANEILDDFIEYYYEDDEIFNVADAFAQYRPEGGEFLYDKKTIKNTCHHLIKLLNSRMK